MAKESPPSEPDRDLVRRCLEADEEAWQILVARYGPVVAAQISRVHRRSVGRNLLPVELQEMVQEVFVAVAADGGRVLRNFRWRARLGTYLASVAACRVLDRFRIAARERARWGPRADFGKVLEGLSLEVQGPEAPLLAGEAADEIRRAVEALPDRERIAVEMRFWEGLTHARVARILGVSEEYARRILESALDRLRRKISERK